MERGSNIIFSIILRLLGKISRSLGLGFTISSSSLLVCEEGKRTVLEKKIKIKKIRVWTNVKLGGTL